MRETAINRLKSYFEDIFHDRKNLIRILLIVLILMLALAVRIVEDRKSDITIENNTGDVTSEEVVSGEICVDISGAVVSPGVYNVQPSTRLYEVIELAGGLLSDADTDSINRAEYVEDGQKIIIPLKRSSAEGDSAETVLSAGVTQDGLVNINYASREELMTLSGIGESKADSIIEYRSSTRFRNKEDIKSVNGIGDAIYNKIKDSITV